MAATLKQVAQAAGVSIRTVTRALKNEPGGNIETYEKVRQVAVRLGYVPNIAARNLKVQQCNIVGLMMARVCEDIWLRMRTALEQKLEHEGKFLLSGTIPESEEQLRALLLEWSGLIRHVLLLRWPPDFNQSKVLAGLPMKFIFIDCIPDPEPHNAIVIDRNKGIREGIEHFLAGGRRRIAHCGKIMFSRLQGFEAAISASPNPVDKYFIKTPGLDFKDGYDAGKEILQKRIDAVFFETDLMALGFYRFADEQKIRIPYDVAVFGFNNELAGLYAIPPLSTVVHPIEEITDRVLTMISAPSKKSMKSVFPTRFISRGSI